MRFLQQGQPGIFPSIWRLGPNQPLHQYDEGEQPGSPSADKQPASYSGSKFLFAEDPGARWLPLVEGGSIEEASAEPADSGSSKSTVAASSTGDH